MKGSMLSRDIAFYNGKPIILRTMKKTILTSSMRSNKITVDECNFLAAITLRSVNTEPLS